MFKFLQYFARFQTLRGQFGGLPAWARGIITLAALPGILLILLSIVALLVSIAALLLLTVPVYRALSLVLGTSVNAGDAFEGVTVEQVSVGSEPPRPNSPRRQVEVKIVE